jgi:radical SAM-linked protein
MSETRQRWRLIVRRGPEARGLGQREIESLWAEGLARAGVPVAMTDTARPRPRIAFAAPVPAGALAELEPIDLFLAERLRIAELRPRLLDALPSGHELVDLFDVWVGEPALAARVVAADYRLEVPDAAGLADACAELLASPRLDRPRRRGEEGRMFDLRPLVASLESQQVGPDRATAGAVIRMRLRHHQELGNGRPDDVLAALADLLGRPLVATETVRERLVLAGEPP